MEYSLPRRGRGGGGWGGGRGWEEDGEEGMGRRKKLEDGKKEKGKGTIMKCAVILINSSFSKAKSN